MSLIGLPTAVFADATWVGDTSQDWNTAANWSSDPANPTGSFFIKSNTVGIYPIISATSAFAPVDILIGDAGSVGRLDQTAGSLATGSGNWLMVGRNGTATYNLTGGTLTAGEIHMARTTGTAVSTGTMNVTNATANTTGATVIEDGNNVGSTCQGTLNMGSGATLNSEGDLLIAFAGNAASFGEVNVSPSATVNVATATKRWLIVSQWDLLQGRLNVNGGTVNLNANTDLRFSTGNNSGSNVVNLNSGAITFWSGNKANPTSPNGVVDLNRSSGSANNTFNLNGGTLTTYQIQTDNDSGTAAFNFNGGTLKANASTVNFIQLGGGSQTANVLDGGAIIDSAGFNLTVPQALLGGGTGIGGLTKIGNGTLVMSGALSYTGPTKVLGGVLNLNSAFGLPSGGDLVVSNATLTLNASSGALSVNNANVALGATLNIAANPNANAITAAGGLSLGTNNTISLAYGTVTANPTVAALAASGSLTKGTNIVINLSATGLGVGIVPLITAGAGTINTNGFVIGSLPSGVKAVLTNNTSGSLDLLITSAGQLLSWHGADISNNPLTNWDVNVTANWYDLSFNLVKYLQYSGNTIGDNVIFGDNSFNTDGTNHVNLAGTVLPATVFFSSSSPYTLTGAGGIGGATSVVLTNMNNSVFIGTSNSYTGGTVVGGGSLVITNNNALGATAGGLTLGGGALQLNAAVTNSRPLTLSANSTIGVVAGAAANLGGAISGNGTLTKNDNGTLTLAGNGNFTGSAVVSAGTLNLAGSVTNTAVTVGDVAGLNAMLGISGSVNANSLLIGNNGGVVAGVIQTGGNSVINGGGGDCLNVGNIAGAVGYYNVVGGTVTANGVAVGGENNTGTGFTGTGGNGLMEINGGTVNNIGWLVMSRGATAETGILNIFSGSLTWAGGGLVCNWGSGQTAIINVMGGSAISTNTGIGLGSAGNTGILNLNGGVASSTDVGGNFGGTFGQVNFNGGTLKAVGATANLVHVTSANIYSNGGTIDDGGYAVTVSQPLLAPAGYGVSSISLSDGGSGYIVPPIVSISGGTGSNATAIASVSGGVVTGITVTSPGNGYDIADAPSMAVSLSGGGASAVAPATITVSLALNTSGGITKKGAGTLTLSGANTYTGTTMVTNGTLLFTPSRQTVAPVVVANGATFGVVTAPGTNASIGNLTLGGTGAGTLSFSYSTAGNPTNVALNAGAVTVNGGSSIKIGGVFNVGTFPLLKYTTLSSVPTLIAPRGTTATLSNDTANTTLYVRVTATGGGIVWTGNTGLIPNLWDINVTTNWLTGVTLTTYQEPIAPGDVVTFNDSGSGTVLVSNTVSPANVGISNSVAYTFQGSGQINSTLGLTKLGTGTVTLSLPGTYSGSTVISNGTVNLGANQTFANLSGNGTVATSAGAPVLTANNTTNTTFSGSLQGSVALTKTGNGTLTLSGASSSTSGRVFVTGGSLAVAGGSTTFGTGLSRVGYLANNGDLTLTGGSLTTGGELQVGGSDQNGTANNATGTVTVANATLAVGMLNIGRGNNNQNTVSGTVTLNSGGTINSEGDVMMGFAGNNNLGKIVINGGTLNVATTTKRWLIMSQWDTSQSQVDINSGQLNLDAGTDIRFAISGNTGTNVINLNGGTVTSYTDNHTTLGGAGVVDLHQGNGSTVDNTFNLNGGTLNMFGILSANNAGNRTFNFNGGTLKATANNASFVNLGTGNAVANVRNGGAIIDSAGFSVSVPQVLQHSAISGDNATDGGLTKIGNGTLNLDGANTYTGPTTVNAGALGGTGSIAGNVTVNSGGSLAPGDGAIGALTVNGNLTLNANSTNVFEVNGTTPANDSLIAGASVTYGGVLKIVPSGTLTAGQTFTLFSGAGAVNTGNFASVQSATPGTTFSFTNGVLTVVSVSTTATYPTNITSRVNGSNLEITWPATHLGWMIQAQTNTLNVGLSSNWFTISNTATQLGYTNAFNPANGAVFYRLRMP